ncbi:MAG: KH domain-containing protein [Candidatus Pacebacteria bacterium]|nr:KH domain-containing protein [Candidatus Paceibacterota bacterium]
MSSSSTQKIEEFVRHVTSCMQIPCELSITAENGAVRVALSVAEDGRLLIGKNGQNLKALEHIVRMVAVRNELDQRAVTVDVNNYRAEQTQQLIDIVHATAVRVQQTKRSEALEPMTSYQRRVVHTELASYSDLSTESVGQDPLRRVVIKPSA